MENLKAFLPVIYELCKLHKVKTLFAFGSVLTDRFGQESDVDFIVDLFEKDPLEYTEDYFGLKFGLEKILRRQIDLLEERSDLNPVVKKEIERSKTLIYEG
jgi:predicted nucleotidyltransferase